LGRTGDDLGPLVCCRKACHKAKRRVGVVLAVMLGPERPEVVLPDRALCLPTFNHLLIVNKLLSLSLSLSLTHTHTHPEESLYLPTFNHLFDSLSLSLSLSLSIYLSISLLVWSGDSPSSTSTGLPPSISFVRLAAHRELRQRVDFGLWSGDLHGNVTIPQVSETHTGKWPLPFAKFSKLAS